MDITTKTNQEKYLDPIDYVLDREWVKSTFIVRDADITGNEYADWIRKNRYYSSADNKFTSTSPGMSIGVNPAPQFTRYCDVRSKGRLKNRPDINLRTTTYKNSLGMGRYYSEAIDDNQQRIFMRFGVPQYIPLPVWLYNSFDIDKVTLQNRGIITTTLLEGIGLVAKFFAVVKAPLLGLAVLTLGAITKNARFYSVKGTMYIYWATVENILNQLVARRTMLPHVFQDFTIEINNKINREQTVTPEFVAELNSLLPGVIDGVTGRISVFALALRAQAVFNTLKYDEMEANKVKSLSSDFTGVRDLGGAAHDTYFTNPQGEETIFTKYLFRNAYEFLIKPDKEEKIDTTNPANIDQRRLTGFDPLATDENGNPIDTALDPNNPADTMYNRMHENAVKKKDKWDRYKEYALAELSGGATFAIFNVENTGSVGESFSNSFTNNPIETTFNSFSTKIRNMTDILSSAASIPVVGDAMKFAADAGATILSNATFGLANPLLALAYGVNITMPKIWESSNATLPRSSYKIKLISPYGNSYSQLFNIYLPLSMIMAGSLPRSTGATSYMSPFFCQVFDRGRTSIQVGMIENVSFTRGTSNLAFTRSGQPNAIDVDLSIANLDEVVSVDVSSAGVIGKLKENISLNFSETPFTTYLNTITGVDAYSQYYRIPLIRLKMAERWSNIRAVINPDPAAFAAFTVNNMPLGPVARAILSNNQAALQDLTNR